ncbi:hypothetical protein [Serratia ficaria]|uniref:hypothetical protein n=1 Tax=Serratia ficaria TaxID=61651 RepID=UPI0021BB6104|nr:hypothetical protein [Serratia ficaria]
MWVELPSERRNQPKHDAIEQHLPGLANTGHHTTKANPLEIIHERKRTLQAAQKAP